jgi:hypothetical protein
LTNTKKTSTKRKDKTNTYIVVNKKRNPSQKRRYPKLNQPIKINLISRTNKNPINDPIRKEFWKEQNKGIKRMISKGTI